MSEVELTLLHCPHNYWQEARCSNGIITAVCRNKKCQDTGQFTLEEWNTMGDSALNKPVRV